MKRKKEKRNFKIDLLNLEKLSEESMKHILGANEIDCKCVLKQEYQEVTIMEFMENVNP